MLSRRFPLWRAAALCAAGAVAAGFARLDVPASGAAVVARLDVPASGAAVVARLAPYKHLTISGWCFGFQMIHLVLSFVVEWQHWRGMQDNNKFIEKITKIKDSLYRGISFPVTIQMCVLFWALHGVDRELVYPAAWDGVVPRGLHAAVHGAVPAAAVAELAVARDGAAPGQRAWELALYWALSAGYALLLDAVYLYSGTWIYPFLGCFTWWQLVLFQLAYCCFGRVLLELVWKLDQAPLRHNKVQ